MTAAPAVYANRIPSATFQQILPQVPETLALSVSASIFGENSAELPVLLPHEQMVVAALVRHFAPRRLFEFGTATGRTTWVLAENSPADARVLTLDLPPPELTDYSKTCLEDQQQTGAIWHAAPSAGKVEQLLVDAAKLDTEAIVARHGRQDFLLIDGDHRYAGVRTDTEKALAIAAPDAVFLWHDFYLLDFVARQPPAQYDVYQYLNDFSADCGFVLRHIVGTYFVVGSRRFAADTPGQLLQPRSVAPFGSSIVQLGETAVGYRVGRAAPADAYALGMAAYQRKDHAGAHAAWLPLAEAGHGEAAAGIATMHINGEGVPADAARAAHWFGVAAGAGHALAQLNLAIMLFNGQGVSRDARRAEDWAKRSLAGLPEGNARDIALRLSAAAAAA